MSEKKYEFTGETKVNDDGVTLHRIRALRDFGNVKKGDLGGWIEKEENLSHEGNCWVADDAEVSGRAKVYGSARVYENAQVSGRAEVYGDAQVYGNAEVYGYAKVYDKAQVYGDVCVKGTSELFGNARVYSGSCVGDIKRLKRTSKVSENENTDEEDRFHPLNERYDKENSLWFLREGDFRPEQVKNFNGGRGIATENDLKLLREAGNLFSTREEAEKAYKKVKKELRNLWRFWL